MEIVLRATAIYIAIWAIFRIAGKRTLRDITTFDFVLLLIISECTQQGLIGQNYSVTGALLAVSTLVGLDIAFSLLKSRFHRLEGVLDNVPVILMEKGRLHPDRMRMERIDEEDILSAARERHGIRRLEAIDYAILEVTGAISIIPKQPRVPIS